MSPVTSHCIAILFRRWRPAAVPVNINPTFNQSGRHGRSQIQSPSYNVEASVTSYVSVCAKAVTFVCCVYRKRERRRVCCVQFYPKERRTPFHLLGWKQGFKRFYGKHYGSPRFAANIFRILARSVSSQSSRQYFLTSYRPIRGKCLLAGCSHCFQKGAVPVVRWKRLTTEQNNICVAAMVTSSLFKSFSV